MERIRALINKLHEQSESNAEASVLLITLQMIQAELQAKLSVPGQINSSNVSVMLPSANRMSFVVPKEIPAEPVKKPDHKEPATERRKPVIKQPVPEVVKEPTQPVLIEPVPVQQPQFEESLPVDDKQPAFVELPKITEPARKLPEKEIQPLEAKKDDRSGWLFDPPEEVPTLAHQTEFRERNDAFTANRSSLNDRLKTEKKELASVLTDGPVRDLKKAIGINDRFVFLNELFRGDEAMYERSLKTINNFRIYPEAEYWIERELKVKLGWDENKEPVQHFRQLVKRRFM